MTEFDSDPVLRCATRCVGGSGAEYGVEYASGGVGGVCTGRSGLEYG